LLIVMMLKFNGAVDRATLRLSSRFGADSAG